MDFEDWFEISGWSSEYECIAKSAWDAATNIEFTEIPHKNIYTYDGAFKCGDCGSLWGAVPGDRQMPLECDSK